MADKDRITAYTNNGYAWPPHKHTTKGWPPVRASETAAFSKTRDQIEAWIRRDLHGDERQLEFSNLVQTRYIPSFTQNGFKVLDFKTLNPSLWQQYVIALPSSTHHSARPLTHTFSHPTCTNTRPFAHTHSHLHYHPTLTHTTATHTHTTAFTRLPDDTSSFPPPPSLHNAKPHHACLGCEKCT